MATAAQIEANRRNAQKSTGPRTEAGKAMSRRNAWRHGFFCETVKHKDPAEEADFARLRAMAIRTHNPRNPMELWLVDQIALALWKLRNVQGQTPPEMEPLRRVPVYGDHETIRWRQEQKDRQTEAKYLEELERRTAWEDVRERREQRLISRILRLRRELREAQEREAEVELCAYAGEEVASCELRVASRE